MACRFSIEILADKTVYEFSFEADRHAILTETLTQIAPGREIVLYDRRGTEIHFDKSLDQDQRLRFVFEGTRENQLYLTNSVSQKVDVFKAVYDWFKKELILISPDAQFAGLGQLIQDNNPSYPRMNELFDRLDTGVIRLTGTNVDPNTNPFIQTVLSMVQEAEPKNRTLELSVNDIENRQALKDFQSDRLIVSREKGTLSIKKLQTQHRKKDGTLATFDIGDESDGTQRLVDLLPAFIQASAQKERRVYFIDELDRSLHTLLTRRLIEMYLAHCSPDTRAQVLFTTHDVLLMDQSLLRRDEMWVTERESTGNSKLISFSEYKDVRYDKDIRKSYLSGRLGGIPRLLLAGTRECNSVEGSEGIN